MINPILLIAIMVLAAIALWAAAYGIGCWAGRQLNRRRRPSISARRRELEIQVRVKRDRRTA